MKHRKYAFVLLPLCALAVGQVAANAPYLPPAPIVSALPLPVTPPQRPDEALYTHPVAKGVRLWQETETVGPADGPLVATIIGVNPKVKGVSFEAALGQDRVWGTDPTFGREVVSTMVVRHNAVAGVNAGFFPFMGNPIGLHIQNGELVTEPQKNRTSFYIDKRGVPHIRAFAFSSQVRNTQTGETFALSGINRKPAVNGDTLLLFTPIFSDRTLRAPGRSEAVVPMNANALVAGRTYKGVPTLLTYGGQTPIAPGRMVLSGVGEAADFLKRAWDAKQPISVQTVVTPLPNPGETDTPTINAGDIKEAVTGAVRLLTDGQITLRVKEEGMGQDFSTTRHPRTAVGITKSGEVLLVTVDGRQKDLSRGASLFELAKLLLKYGAVDAVNLDGGGSSACVVRGLIVNSPSEGKERPVADALLVRADSLSTTPVTSKRKPRLSLPNRPLKTSEMWSVWPYRQRILSDEAGVWGTRGGVGFVFQDGQYLALRPGKGEVAFAPADGTRALSAQMTIVGAGIGDAAGFMAKLALVQDATNPLKATLTLRIANAEGDPLANETVSVSVSGGKADAAIVTTDKTGTARLGIIWDAAGAGSVTVSSPAQRFTKTTLPATTMTPSAPGS